MASNCLFSSDHIFSSEFSQIPPVSVSVEESLESSLMWNQQFILPSSEQNGYTSNDPIILPSNDLTFSSNFDGVLPFPEQLKISPMLDYVPEPILMTSNEFEVGFSDYSSTGNNSSQHQYQKTSEFFHFQQPDELSAYNDEELLFNKTYSENGFGPRFDHAAGYFGDHNIWEIHHNLQSNYNSASSFQSSSGSCSSVEEPKVRRYTKEERNDRILKYLKKKNQRNFNKTIKYVCRKTLADRRIRIRGRFARNNEYPEELSTTSTTKNNTNDHEEEDKYHHNHDPYFHNGTPETKLNIELEDEEWLREAVNNLMYLPIFD
ncbi:hypothetical protein C5167_041245 [Papaver somniferum]|uniref:CCT domain-containing protein n=1 Tax=Papaver somniferum TaxID=3469 RepID=A0A4Y7ILH0_PAPSO|nr:uncharacterized protein LOC113275838 [Papaver somniferum]RZC48298.1 hypothetical protein C5167_041245 [Papaver somniferum]